MTTEPHCMPNIRSLNSLLFKPCVRHEARRQWAELVRHAIINMVASDKFEERRVVWRCFAVVLCDNSSFVFFYSPMLYYVRCLMLFIAWWLLGEHSDQSELAVIAGAIASLVIGCFCFRPSADPGFKRLGDLDGRQWLKKKSLRQLVFQKINSLMMLPATITD